MHAATELFLCGISHECADAKKIGECSVAKSLKCALEASVMADFGASECAVLSTCNRVECYFAAPENADAAAVVERIFGANAQFCYILRGAAAVAHLFEVASGLRSQMTGETEIFGQVKSAYSSAFEVGHCAAVLNTVFQKAAHVGKWIRTNTDIGHGKISIGGVSAELAAQIFDDIRAAQILLIGSGVAGRLIADALFVRGAKNITIVSRTRKNADALAERVGVHSDDFTSAMARFGMFDIVVCASGAGEIIGAEFVEKSVAKRNSPMFIIDLSVPKNVSEKCAELDGVFLYDMHSLSKIANENMSQRKAEIERARGIIAERASAVAARLFGQKS